MTDKTPTIIGEFESVPNNKPRKIEAQMTPPPAAPTPAPEGAPSKEDATKALSDLAEALRPPTPEEKAKRYLEGLSAVGVTQGEARAILDAVLFNDYYEEIVEIGRGVVAVIRTRTYTDTQRMLRMAEAEAPQIPRHYNDILARCNVAASLVEYNKERFSVPVKTEGMTRDAFKKLEEEAFQDKLEYLMNLPTPVVTKLIYHVSRFDEKILAVFEEGAPEDF
jgi:hypothetical protein